MLLVDLTPFITPSNFLEALTVLHTYFPGQVILEDEVMYSGASVEKYNLMKPSKQKKSSSTIKRLRDYISTNGNEFLLHLLYTIKGVWAQARVALASTGRVRLVRFRTMGERSVWKLPCGLLSWGLPSKTIFSPMSLEV